MSEQNDYLKYVQQACDYAGINLTDNMLENLQQYYELLIEWNQKINLTAITEKSDVYLKHFADSIYGAKYFKQNSVVCDMGTGAGFPGLVLKIVRPDLKVILVDALDKRVKFLNEVINTLQLNNIQAIHFRAEDKLFKDKYLNSFDHVTARAVAKMSTLSEYCLPFVKVGGEMLAYKSDKINDELYESKKAIEVLGGGKIDVLKYQLNEDTERLIIKVIKKQKTDKKYPRDKNKPKTSPII